jgi:hypothetical protein
LRIIWERNAAPAREASVGIEGSSTSVLSKSSSAKKSR